MALALYVTAVLTSGPLKGALSAFDPGARALARAPPAQLHRSHARACSMLVCGRSWAHRMACPVGASCLFCMT